MGKPSYKHIGRAESEMVRQLPRLTFAGDDIYQSQEQGLQGQSYNLGGGRDNNWELESFGGKCLAGGGCTE